MEEQEHVLKGLPRLRYRRPEHSLEHARTSLHRWWWEFLRLSRDYWMVCQTSRGLMVATEDERLRRVFRRFGDIYSCSFEEWWLERGYSAFSEVEKFPKVQEVARDIRQRRRQSPEHDKIWVEVPLKLSKRTVQKQLGKLLDHYESSRLSRRLQLTTAEFQIQPSQVGDHTLKKVHEVHALHRELIDKPTWLAQHQASSATPSPRADLFRIGKLLHISPSNESLNGEPADVRKRLNRMRVAVSRNLQRSRELIANVEIGKFPSYAAVESHPSRFTPRQLEKHKELEGTWWSLNLLSELSQERVASVHGIQYQEPERTRQNDLFLARSQRRVIIRDA